MNPWLEVFGRAHTMVLHLPIGLCAALVLLELFGRGDAWRSVQARLAWATAATAALAASSGWLHGDAQQMEGSSFELHRNLSIAFALFGIVAALLATRAAGGDAAAVRRWRVAGVAWIALLVPAGHFGADLTHGAGFLTSPLRRAAPQAPPDAPGEAEMAPIARPSSFAEHVQPILASHCGACHGEAKRKAGLDLSTAASIAAGGRRGPPIDVAAPKQSLLLARLELSLDDDKHMPPADEAQLSAAQVAVLRAWVLAGGPFDGSVDAIDAARAAANELDAVVENAAEVVRAGATASAVDALAPVDPAALAALSETLAHIEPLHEGSPWYWVDFAACASAIDDEAFERLLAPLHERVVDISAARCAIGSRALGTLTRFSALERLDLRATAVDSAALARISGHPSLRELVLTHTRLDESAIETLLALPALERLHLWDCGLDATAIARLREARPGLWIGDGGVPSRAPIEAEPEVAFVRASPPAAPSTKQAESSTAAPSLVAVNTICPVSGAAVKAAFTILYEGRAIGFCCPECPRQFWADPAKFLAGLR